MYPLRNLLVLFITLALAATAASAQDTLWTPQHVAKLRIVTEAVIAPDGTQVAYVLSVPRDLAKEKDGPSWAELHVVDTKGNSTPFISGQVNVASIAWTPDGKQIAFLSKRDKDATRSLYVIGAKGGEARKLLEHATDIQGYSFSGDGKQIAFLATEPTPAGKKKLADQGFNQEIYEEDQPFVRVWIQSRDRKGAGHEEPLPNGRGSDMLKLAGSASELHFNPKENKLAVALAPSPGIDDHLMFRKVHIVEFQSRDREGAIVTKATNLNNPGKLGQLAWSPDGKQLAMISGKDKHYGALFSMKGQKDAGGKEFDDLIDGVDHLVKMGLVDENKVGITGGSYGGYATAWGSTYYSHRFAAGVMFVGISDWISCSGTTDIPQEMFLVHHRKWLWDDWEYFKKASPLSYLDKAKTPLLILHGKADPRVNPGQSLELYRHLKVRNQAPVRLVLYPGEGHGNRRAASKLDYNLRLLQWMEHYLKGPGGPMPPMDIEYGLTPAKTSSAGWDNRAPLAAKHEPWLGRGCPCCIGW